MQPPTSVGETRFSTILISSAQERNFVRDLHACARDLSIYLLTTGVILRRRTAIKPRAEFTVTGSNSFSFSLFLSPFFLLSRSRSHSLFSARVLRGFMVRVMGSWTGWIPWSMGLWLNPSSSDRTHGASGTRYRVAFLSSTRSVAFGFTSPSYSSPFFRSSVYLHMISLPPPYEIKLHFIEIKRRNHKSR